MGGWASFERVTFEQRLGGEGALGKWGPEVNWSRQSKCEVQRPWGRSKSGVFEEGGGAGEE